MTDDDKVTVVDPAPLGEPELAGIFGRAKPGRTKGWIHHLEKGAAAGASSGSTRSFSGVPPRTRYGEPGGPAARSETAPTGLPDSNARTAETHMASRSHGQWSATAVRHVVEASEDAPTAIVAVVVATAVMDS
ncbi:hypothetical protein [Streptomyces sp. DSM 40750]|uniref:hypothetical protein n=1 Tax=Streptomyces sp. DSM 40750 TaxID=2801030 RepID=UPI00214C209D|nr:hypothetical protein [Streptomyces sp. DSM 40750]UUU25894.1 hypothetical protein JIX55_39825 [Streptomyces sp. DSM 40750]